MYFTAPSGRPIDVVVDQLTMCHTLDFRPSFDRLPLTLDAVDLLLSNCRSSNSTRRTHGTSCSCWPRCRWLTPARLLGQDPPRAPGPQRGSTPSGFCKLLSADWGWWRTVTANLAKLPGLVAGRPELRFASPPLDPLTQAARLAELAEATPKGMKWRLRANIGDRVRWYELPEEVGH